MLKHLAIAALTIFTLACSGGDGVKTTKPNPGSATSYGFFRKLNPTTKSSKAVVAMAAENLVVTMASPRSGHKAIQIAPDLFMLVGGEYDEGKGMFDRAVERPATIDYFDRSTETFTHKGSITTHVSRHWYSDGTLSFSLLRLPNGNVLMVGGADAMPETVEVFNPTTETVAFYSSVFPAATPVNNVTDAFYMGDNKVLLVGCRFVTMAGDPQTILRGNAVLDLTTMKARLIPTPALVAREGAVQLADGSVVIMGGMEGDYVTVHRDIWRVSPDLTTTRVAEMSTPRIAFGACLLTDGKVGIYGGVNYAGTGRPQYPQSVDIYDPSDNSVVKSTDLPLPRNSTTPVMLPNGFTLNAGGASEGDPVSIETVHNHVTGVVGSTGNLTTARCYFSTIPLNNGRFLISGGEGGSAALNTAEIYDPATQIVISYGSATVGVGATAQFTSDKACSWSVVSLDPSKGPGTISESGVFTAPTLPTKVKITATSSDGSGDVIINVV